MSDLARLLRRIEEPLDLRYFVIAVGVAAVHMAAAIALLLGGPAPLTTTPVYFTSWLLNENYIYVAWVLAVASILAIIPFLTRRPPRVMFMLLIAPQQCLLLLHLVSVMVALTMGHYPDGYVPHGGSYFIFVDQSWLLMIVVLHTFGYIETL